MVKFVPWYASSIGWSVSWYISYRWSGMIYSPVVQWSAGHSSHNDKYKSCRGHVICFKEAEIINNDTFLNEK